MRDPGSVKYFHKNGKGAWLYTFAQKKRFSNYFRRISNFLQLFFKAKVSSQAPTKYFRLFQKKCSKHLWSSTTPGLYNAPRMKVIGCVEKKERNENSDECNFHSHQRMRSGFDPDFFVLSKRLFGIYCLFTLRWNSTIWNATKIFSLKNADLVPSKWEFHVFFEVLWNVWLDPWYRLCYENVRFKIFWQCRYVFSRL